MKVHKGGRKQTKVHAAKKGDNPKYLTWKKNSFLSHIWWLAYPSVQKHKSVRCFKKYFISVQCLHSPAFVLLLLLSHDASKGSPGNERDALCVKNKSAEVWGEKRQKEGIYHFLAIAGNKQKCQVWDWQNRRMPQHTDFEQPSYPSADDQNKKIKYLRTPNRYHTFLSKQLLLS